MHYNCWKKRDDSKLVFQMCSTLKWKAEFCAAGKKAKQNELYKVFSAYFPAFSQAELRYREPSVNPFMEDMK